MPFKSEKQRKWMHANDPDMADEWEKKKKKEGKFSTIMKAVRKGPKAGPWNIIISKNNKIKKQVSVKNLKEIPAFYEDLKKAYPNYNIGIEAKDGKIVYRESVTEMNSPMFKIFYKDSRGAKKTDYMRAKNPKLAKRDFDALNKSRGFKILKVVKESIDEGSCGYGIDGQLGNEPAGPHLLKKKKKKKDEASLGSMISKNIGKHGGTRNKAEVEKIIKYLIKKGDTKNTALDKIKQNYDYVSKKYRTASISKKAQILTSLQESVNESRANVKKAIAIAKKMGGNMSGAVKKIEKIQKGLSKQIEVEDALKTANESVSEKIKLKGKSKGTISHLGMPKASKGVEKLFKIADSGFGKVGGQTVDSMSANLFKQIYDKASDDIKMKLNKKNEKQLIRIIAGMWNKFGKNVKLGSSL